MNNNQYPHLSILMPAYNAEKYIGQAIESVINQSYKNWELLVVDDCSTDQTEKIISEYTQNDSRVRYFKLSRNSGNPYVPRNEAARLSCGEYLIHLDSDDYLEINYLSKFVIRQEETCADGVLGVMKIVSEDGTPLNRQIPQSGFDLTKELSGREAFKQTVPWRIGLNGAGFRREIVMEAISQHANYSHGAWCDEVLSRMFLLNSKKVVFISGNYFYRENNSSLVHTFSPKLLDMCLAAKDVCLLCKNYFPKDSKTLANGEMYIFNYTIHVIRLFVQHHKSLASSDKKLFKNKLRSFYEDLNFNIIKPQLGIKSRILTTNGFNLCYAYYSLLFKMRK